MRCVTEPCPYQLFVDIDVAARSFSMSWLQPHGRPSDARTFLQTAAATPISNSTCSRWDGQPSQS
jgi:hypothetical protein